MGWLEWSSSIIGSVAWPLAAFAIAWIFRAQISGLLKSIRKLSWGDKIVDFAAELDKIEDASLGAIQNTQPVNSQQPVAADERFNQLLEISPAAAVLDAWLPIENRLREIGDQYKSSTDYVTASNDSRLSQMGTRQVMNMLGSRKLVEKGVLALLGELQALRNAAAHHGDVTVVDAIRFKSFANQVMAVLNQVEIT